MAIVGDTTSTTAAATFSAINGNSGSKTKTTSSVEDQQNKFLTLLMTQIKNQDPLNPMDNAAVTTQLAQLNTVSGIEKLNATMTQLLDGYNETQAIQSTGMIGKNVMVAGNNLPLNKSEAVGGVLLEAAAYKVTLNIKDSTGISKILRRIDPYPVRDPRSSSLLFGTGSEIHCGRVLLHGR